MTQRELALRTGRPTKTINEIIKGKTEITAETALQLERVLRIPARFWINRERHYREYLARQDEHDLLRENISWLKQIPVRRMIEYGWIQEFSDRVQQVKEVLEFFGVRSPKQYKDLWNKLQVSFRMSPSFRVSRDSLAAWLRKGVIQAQAIECETYDADKFKRALISIRRLTLESPKVFMPELARRCARCGVAVVFTRELPKTRVSGATKWLTPEKALIQLSFRYKSDDMVWFTFFHEAGHILLDGKSVLFLEGDKFDGDKETRANRFAESMLIPKRALQEFIRVGLWSEAAIRRFAGSIGISPGLVVGRLQYLNYLPRTHLNGLKRRLRWPE